MEAAGIKSVEHDSVELVVDGLMKAELAPNATIDDAIYELESTGIARSAQLNYVYEIMEEQEPALDEDLDDDEPEIVDATEPDEVESADDASAPTESDEPILTDEADAVDEQPDVPSEINIQSTSPTAARDALNDTYASKQWNLDSIDAFDAWEFPPLKNATTTVGVGVLDNGLTMFTRTSWTTFRVRITQRPTKACLSAVLPVRQTPIMAAMWPVSLEPRQITKWESVVLGSII